MARVDVLALQGALSAAERGLPVTPSRGKRPVLTGWQDRGSTDQNQIRSWSREYSEVGYGVVVPAWLVVLDVDHDDLSGLPSSCALFVVRTPRPGWHLYFELPDGMVRPRLRAPRAGIDVKGPGTLVMCPGSLHPKGGRYRWAALPS